LLLVVGAVACRSESLTLRGPRLTARWTGADTAEFSARATAEWCDTLHVLEIRAISGDTGVGIALYPPDRIGRATYRIHRPDVADSALPPSASVGLRWSSQTAVLGFRSDSGEVTLEQRPGGALGGRFTLRARALTGTGQLQVTGSLEGLRPTEAPPTCAGRGVADSVRADTTGGDEPGATPKD
jgi:hypothetical protein